MKRKCDLTRETNNKQRGAALVTVLFISLLLLTASAAMLTAVGSNSRNTTDVLSETKAYYAAESGLQATINFLRNDPTVPQTTMYSYAAANPTLSAKLPYNWPTPGATPDRVVIGQNAATYTTAVGTAYSINVTDPDNSAAHTTFTTVGSFEQSDPSLPFTATRVFGTTPDTTTISFTGVTTTLNHPDTSQSLGRFVITKAGAGAAITSLPFRIDYFMTAPRAGVLSIRGTIAPAAAADASTTASFVTQYYPQLGSQFKLCSALGGTYTCPDASVTIVTNDSTSGSVYAYVAPMEPTRLKVVATGYGPSAVNKLEAIVQRNLFNGLGSGAATTMIGAPCPDPDSDPCFEPGSSNGVAYNGCATVATQGCIPSFGVTDPTNLGYIQANPPGGGAANMQPPPALLSPNTLPSWQQSPAALDALVDQLRTVAQHSGRYFAQGSSVSNPGNFAQGTGITFCEGSCNVSGDGGGVLIVTGMLTNNGNFSFKGMIIVTGEEGWLRNGGGNGQVIGNVVIAPYNRMSYVPENLSSTFLPPQYHITGGGGSDIIFGDVNASFDTTLGITDFVAGVAEK